MSIEAMKQALAALDGIHPGNMTPMAEEYWNKAITALRTAIEEAENHIVDADKMVQEPSRTQTKQIVDGLRRCHHPGSQHEFLRTWIRNWTIHKTAQRQWIELTRSEAMEIINSQAGQDWRYAVDAIEAKPKEKNA